MEIRFHSGRGKRIPVVAELDLAKLFSRIQDAASSFDATNRKTSHSAFFAAWCLWRANGGHQRGSADALTQAVHRSSESYGLMLELSAMGSVSSRSA
jgi:hypothetical protein